MNAPFSPEAMSTVTQSLIIMAEGMAGIFIFMAIFYGLIELLNRLFKSEKVGEK
jgi:Na+-transporting methylmalonyl-CoA/oxaloacetate decarboxylase gamma subunit